MKWPRLRSWLLARVFISGMGAALMGRDEWRVKKRCDVSKLEGGVKTEAARPPKKLNKTNKKTEKTKKMAPNAQQTGDPTRARAHFDADATKGWKFSHTCV